MCKTDGFVAVVDKNMQRRIRALTVRCRFRGKGCDWQGELRELADHLDPARGHCEYNEVPCSKGCGQQVLLPSLESHLRNECPNRDQECNFCNKIVTFSYLSKHHECECPKIPVPCPHGCSEQVLRGSLQKHLEQCPMRLVECNFSTFGCSAKVQWHLLAEHMDDSSQKHLCMLATCCSSVQKDLATKDAQVARISTELGQKQKEIDNLKKDVSAQKKDCLKIILQQRKELQEKIDQLEETFRSHAVVTKLEKMEDIQHKIMILETQVPVPPYYFTVSNFALHKQGGTHWTCPSFFSRVGGYKMAIEVSANGEGVGKDTHVSVYIRIMHGEYDDMLRWPLRASVTIQLISQSGNEEHYEMTTPEYEWAQVTSGMVGVGWGWDKFIQHGDLKYNSVRKTEYLKNDRLNFRVISVDESP